jgi:membrane associated rhomboid family serine protease
MPLAELAADVEYLWREGLLRPASRPGDTAPGVTLTEGGARALADPAALAALRGRPPGARARGAAARGALAEARAPVVSRVLLAVNLTVFAVGACVASNRGITRLFLAGGGRALDENLAVVDALRRTGSVSAEDLIAGGWWRLLTAAFVHAGLLHLLLNGSALAFGFGMAEAMWGRGRYLLIYLLAAFGGNCVAMAWFSTFEARGRAGPVEISQPVVGASGALCGVLAAVMVWVVLNGRHLPRSAAAQLRTSLFVAGVFIVFISLFPRVSGLCHLGGALFGAAAAVELHYHRWGAGPVRWTALAGLAFLPCAGLAIIEHERATAPRWQRAERRVFETLFEERVRKVVGDTNRLYANRVAPLLDEPPRKRDAGRVGRVLDEVAKNEAAIYGLIHDLTRSGPYHDPKTKQDRRTALEKVERLEKTLAEAGELLRQNANSPEEDDTEERAFARQFLSRIPGTMAGAIRLYRDEVQPLRQTPAGQRDPAAVNKALRAVEACRRELADLTEALGEAGPYDNAQVETARHAAERYAAARAALLDAASRCLRAGAEWTPEDEAAFQKQADEVTALRGEWDKLVERE